MIQRIQSLLLLLAAILLTVNLFVPVWTNQAASVKIILDAFSISFTESLTGTLVKSSQTLYIAALIIVALLISLFTIFRYQKRRLQIMLCNLGVLISLCITGSFFIAIPKAKSMMLIPSDGNYGLGYFLPILCAILFFAAAYFIRKDEALVRSVDRLR